MTKKIDKLEHNATALKRWRTRLKRAITMIDKLERQRKRLEAKATQPKAAKVERPASPAPVPVPATPDDLAIPTFLQRKKLDPAPTEIVQEQEATKSANA